MNESPSIMDDTALFSASFFSSQQSWYERGGASCFARLSIYISINTPSEIQFTKFLRYNIRRLLYTVSLAALLYTLSSV